MSEVNGNIKSKHTPKAKTRFDWAHGIIDYIQKSNRLVSIDDFNIELVSGMDKQKYRNYLSMALYKLSKRNKIKGYREQGIKNKFYGLPQMFEGNRPTSEYLNIAMNKTQNTM